MSLLLVYPVALVYRTLGQPMALVGYFLVVLTTLVLYVLACDPLPPCEGKVRGWLRRGASVDLSKVGTPVRPDASE